MTSDTMTSDLTTTAAEAATSPGNGKRPARTKTPAAQPMQIVPFNLQRMQVNIVGTTGLICHKWSSKAQQEMLDKQTKRAKVGREAKNPERDFQESLYILEGDWENPENMVFGFPSIAFKQAAVRAGTYAEMKMTFLRGAFHVLPGDMVVINGIPTSRQDMVRVGMGTADIRFRGEFQEWSASIPILYNGRAITTEQITNLFRVAGFSVGIGEWRPERDGVNGMWEIESVEVEQAS